VSQVRITDINNRQMEVIVGEDQLSLAIGKKGQNVRLATRLVGWDIKIVSEDVLKKEIARQMGRMMASGEAVPIAALQGVSATQAEALEQKGITDVEKLAVTSVDDLVEFLDLSLDEAEAILASARSIVEARNEEVAGPGTNEEEIAGKVPEERLADLAGSPDSVSENTAEPVTPPEAENVEAADRVKLESSNNERPKINGDSEASEARDEAAAVSTEPETPPEQDI
jgi:N utilization substance protein A